MSENIEPPFWKKLFFALKQYYPSAKSWLVIILITVDNFPLSLLPSSVTQNNYGAKDQNFYDLILDVSTKGENVSIIVHISCAVFLYGNRSGIDSPIQ